MRVAVSVVYFFNLRPEMGGVRNMEMKGQKKEEHGCLRLEQMRPEGMDLTQTGNRKEGNEVQTCFVMPC